MKIFVGITVLLALAYAQLQPPCNQGLPYLVPYLTEHFQNWLNENGYSSFNFVRSDLPGGSYGGMQNDTDVPVNRPIIFFHGNSDMAIGNGTPQATWQTGFRDAIEYFQSEGYKE